MTTTSIIKRNDSEVHFDPSRIERALQACFRSIGREPAVPITDLVKDIVDVVEHITGTPTVEDVQDIAEQTLQQAGEYDAAKHYILYREEHARLRQQHPIPEHVRVAFDQASAYFPTPLQQFQFYDKYARFDQVLGRRETWIEAVNRVVDYLRELSENKLDSGIYERIHQAILDMDIMPSMRLLAMAGPAARRNNICLYNCAYMPIDDVDAFHEALLISMCGCGVGYSVEKQYIEQLPVVKRQVPTPAWVLMVEDTTEGWVDALQHGITSWFNGRDIGFDFSEIRPAGAVLYTKGGRASGPGPLKTALNAVRSIILSRQGYSLRPLDAHDMLCHIGQAAVSGGVRRTAMIALFSWDDHEMRTCKDGDFATRNSQRWNANNSIVWPADISQQDIINQMMDMINGQRGEPGIFNRTAAQNGAPARRQQSPMPEYGTNPCVTADTWVMTSEGPKQVHALIGKPFTAFVNGMAYPSTEQGFFHTGKKPVYRIDTNEGYTLTATADHQIFQVTEQGPKHQVTKWTPASELIAGDTIRIHDQGDAEWDGYEKHLNFLRTIFTLKSDLMDEKNSLAISLSDCSLRGIQKVQRQLLNVGIASEVVENRSSSSDFYHLIIKDENVTTFDRLDLYADEKRIYLKQAIQYHYGNRKAPFRRERFTATVRSITFVDKQDVYDCTIPGSRAFDANGIYVHNCGEIILRPNQFCNLSIAVARPNDTFDTLAEKVELATIIGTIQSMATHFPGLRPQWQENCEEERLLGVDITGQMDVPLLLDAENLAMFQDHAFATNLAYAKLLGIPASAAITCNKPSGNSSVMLDCSPGIHARWSPFYVRNVRVGASTPMYKVLRDAGVPMDPENGQDAESATTWVAHFPVKAPAYAAVRDDLTALDQCENWYRNKIAWAEHNPSVTITYGPDELLDIIQWVWKHRSYVGGMTFLPRFGSHFDQMPYEKITGEEYLRLADQFPDIDFAKLCLYEKEDYTTAAQEVACSSGTCDIL